MAISQTRQEASKKAAYGSPCQANCHLFDTLFSESNTVFRRTPLLFDALAMFEEHWNAADGAKIQSHAPKQLTLLVSTLLNRAPTS